MRHDADLLSLNPLARAFLSQTWQAGKDTSSPHYGLTAKYFWLCIEGMENSEKPALKRLNVTFTNSAVDEVEQLRILLEGKLKQRLSIAQVMKRLVKQALTEFNT